MPANVETMAYRFADRSDVPWHGLGVPVDRNEIVSTQEFQKRAGADSIPASHPKRRIRIDALGHTRNPQCSV